MLAAAAALLAPLQAAAADAKVADELARCAAIDKAATRLSCYDELAGRKPRDMSSFGVAQRPPEALPEALASMQARVTRVSADSQGHDVVVLDNNQSWVITEGALFASPGDVVTIKRAALGSFLMVTPSRRTYRVMRKP